MTKWNGLPRVNMAAVGALGLMSNALGVPTAEPIKSVLVHGALTDCTTSKGVYDVSLT